MFKFDCFVQYIDFLYHHAQHFLICNTFLAGEGRISLMNYNLLTPQYAIRVLKKHPANKTWHATSDVPGLVRRVLLLIPVTTRNGGACASISHTLSCARVLRR